MKKNQHSYKNLYSVQEPSKRPSFRIAGSANLPNVSTSPVVQPTTKIQKQPYYSTKQNDPTAVNKPEIKKQFKLYTEPSSDVSPQQNKILRLEQQLKRKICDNGFMAYFRASNSSDYSHIDLYLEMASMEQLMADQNRLIKKQQKRLEEQQEQINELERIKQQHEAKFVAHTQQIKKFTDIIDKLQMKMEGEEVPQQPAQFKTLFEDMQRQKITACKKVKELEELTAEQEEQIVRLKLQLGEVEARARQPQPNKEVEKELQTTIQNLKVQSHHHNQQRISLSEQLHLSREQNKILSQEKQSVSSALQKLRREFRELQSHNEELQSRIDQKEEVRVKLQNELQKKAEYKTLLSDAVGRQKKIEQKYQNVKEELRRSEEQIENLSRQLKKIDADRESMSKQLQSTKDQMAAIKDQMVATKDTERQLREHIVKKDYELKTVSEDRKKLQNLVGRLEDDLSRAVQKSQKDRQTHREVQEKLQCANDRLVHQLEKQRLPTAKLKEVCVRLRLILINTGECSNSDNMELQGIANELMNISQRIVCECIFPLREQLENLSVKLKAAEFEKNNGDSRQIQYLHEAMKVLFKFVPEESDRIVQEYLRVMMESEKGPDTIGRKVSLMEAVLKEAEKSRNKTKEERQLTRVPSSQYLEQKTTRASSCRPPMDSSRKDRGINRPNIIKKYFE